MVAEHPLELTVAYQSAYARWLPLVKWLLLVPHFIALVFVYIWMLFAWIGAAVAVLVTGRYPEGLYQVMLGGGRWILRATAYLYLLTDAYPPFAMYDIPSYPVRLELEYPPGGRVARWRPLFAWVLVLPHYLILILIYVGIWVVELIALFSILLTGVFPRELFDLVVRTLRLHSRLNAYALFLTDKHPGFAL